MNRGGHLVPFGCSSEMALYLRVTVLPLLSSTSSSSSSSMGNKKARVGSFSVNWLFSSVQALLHLQQWFKRGTNPQGGLEGGGTGLESGNLFHGHE